MLHTMKACDYLFRNDCFGIIISADLELLHLNYSVEKTLESMVLMNKMTKAHFDLSKQNFSLPELLKSKELLIFVRNGIETLKNSALLEIKSDINSLKMRKIGDFYLILANIKLDEKTKRGDQYHLQEVGSMKATQIKSPTKAKRPTSLKKAYSVTLGEEKNLSPRKRTSLVVVIFYPDSRAKDREKKLRIPLLKNIRNMIHIKLAVI